MHACACCAAGSPGSPKTQTTREQQTQGCSLCAPAGSSLLAAAGWTLTRHSLQQWLSCLALRTWQPASSLMRLLPCLAAYLPACLQVRRTVLRSQGCDGAQRAPRGWPAGHQVRSVHAWVPPLPSNLPLPTGMVHTHRRLVFISLPGSNAPHSSFQPLPLPLSPRNLPRNLPPSLAQPGACCP